MSTYQDPEFARPQKVLAAIGEVVRKGREAGSLTIHVKRGEVVAIDTVVKKNYSRLPALVEALADQPSRTDTPAPKFDIPYEVLAAFEDLLRNAPRFLDEPPTGSLTLHFRNGGVAGIEAMVKKVYKG